MPTARNNGPISFARKAEFCMGKDVLSLRRHDPDQVQRVSAASLNAGSANSQLLDRSSPRNAANVGRSAGVSTRLGGNWRMPESRVPGECSERNETRDPAQESRSVTS